MSKSQKIQQLVTLFNAMTLANRVMHTCEANELRNRLLVQILHAQNSADNSVLWSVSKDIIHFLIAPSKLVGFSKELVEMHLHDVVLRIEESLDRIIKDRCTRCTSIRVRAVGNRYNLTRERSVVNYVQLPHHSANRTIRDDDISALPRRASLFLDWN